MDAAIYIRAIITLTGVLALIGILAFLVRKWGLFTAYAAPKNASSLNIVESRFVDPKRRLIVITYGDSEHLVLLGPHSDLHLYSEQAAPNSPSGNGPTS